MKDVLLTPEEVLSGYDAVSRLYPCIPSLSAWRAWEYAAFRRYALSEPVLDVGCGDGRMFKLFWPSVTRVVGVDTDPSMLAAARQSGIYEAVYEAPAHEMPLPPGCFASAFANSSIEHMDHLAGVLKSIQVSLRPGANFLMSVVTPKFVEWSALRLLVTHLGYPQVGEALGKDHVAYHHLVNPLPIPAWSEQMEAAGFEVLEHMPIVPEVMSRFFLFMDQLWHVRRSGGELGDVLHPYLLSLPSFPEAFRYVLEGLLRMETDWSIGSGAVFFARKV